MAKKMNTKTIIISMLVTITILLTGCTGSYSNRGRHVNHYSQPSTANAYQAMGEMAYQMKGRENGVTSQQYNRNMRGLSALGTLMDFSNR